MADNAARIGAYLSTVIGASNADVTLLSQFLTPSREAAAAPGVGADDRKARTFELLEQYLCRATMDQPAILMIEDLHWCDSTTLELLERLLLERIGDLPIMIILTARPEFLPNWPSGAHISSISVGRLSEAKATAYLDQMEAAAPLPEDTRRQIIDRNDAIPLFLE